MRDRAKKKAEELHEKAFDFIYTSQAHNADDDAAKNCALMVVEEILSIASIDLNEEFWVMVKEEINDLSND